MYETTTTKFYFGCLPQRGGISAEYYVTQCEFYVECSYGWNT
jgi:hypothetical protein